MRIGLAGAGSTIDRIIRQVEQAEADGFCAMWFASMVLGDPLAAIAVAARATSRIELGTGIVVTYPCHPVLMANRAAAVAASIGQADRFTLGVGPSHQPVVEGMLGLSYAHAGRHTDEYMQILSRLLSGETVSFAGEEFHANAGPPALPEGVRVPVLLAALGPRLLRVAGEHADGTILWMANARAIEEHVAPKIKAAAAGAGRPEPRIVAGLPVAVHDDVDEARSAAAEQYTIYGSLPNYQRILGAGGVSSPAEAAVVGDEAAVTRRLEELFEAGATEVWLSPFGVGEDRSSSRARARELLKELATSPA